MHSPCVMLAEVDNNDIQLFPTNIESGGNDPSTVPLGMEKLLVIILLSRIFPVQRTNLSLNNLKWFYIKVE